MRGRNQTTLSGLEEGGTRSWFSTSSQLGPPKKVDTLILIPLTLSYLSQPAHLKIDPKAQKLMLGGDTNGHSTSLDIN